MKIRNNIIHFIKSKTFIISIIVVMMFSTFSIGISSSSNKDVLECYFGNITNSWYIFTLLIIGLINTTKIFNEVRVNYNYLERFNNKYEAYSNFIFITTLINTIIFLIALLFPLIILIFYRNLPFNNTLYEYYNIKYYVYIIFHIIKILFILNNLINIFLITSLLIGSKKSLLLFIIILLDITITPYNYTYVNTILKFTLRPKYYFLPLPYSSFTLEISMTILYISLLICIYNLLFSIFKKIKKDIY